MKRIFQIVSVLCTLFLLGLGANMPHLASLFLDYQLEKEVIQREDVYISLEPGQEKDFFQTLELFYSWHSRIDLSEGYRMTADEAKSTATDTLSKLELFDQNAELEVTPMLFTNKDSSVSGVYWCCMSGVKTLSNDTEMETFDIQTMMWLDDKTGKLVALKTRVNLSDLNFGLNRSFYGTVTKIAEYCRLYYPVDTVTLLALKSEEESKTIRDYVKIKEEQNYVETTIAEYDNNCTLILTQNKDGQEKSYMISIYLQNGWFCFHI